METIERERHPVLRTGEREPIDPYKRRLIYERDGYSCGWCGRGVDPDSTAPGRVLQLDHIVPWSAWGSDRSDNLRSLCDRCNEERSNFVDLTPPRVIGVTTACYWCTPRLHSERTTARLIQERGPDYRVRPDDDGTRISVYCGCCGTTSWVPTEGWIL